MPPTLPPLNSITGQPPDNRSTQAGRINTSTPPNMAISVNKATVDLTGAEPELEVSEVTVPYQVRVLLRSLDGDLDRNVLLHSNRKVLDFGRASTNLERGAGSAVDNAYIDSPIVSREHCRMYADFSLDWAVYLRDLGSTHGTFLNNRKVVEGTATRLYTGDRIRLGIPVVNGPRTYPPRSFEVRFIWKDRPKAQPSIPTPDDSPKAKDLVRTFSVPNASDSEADSGVVYVGENKAQMNRPCEPLCHFKELATINVDPQMSNSLQQASQPSADADKSEDPLPLSGLAPTDSRPIAAASPPNAIQPIEPGDSDSDDEAPESIPIQKSSRPTTSNDQSSPAANLELPVPRSPSSSSCIDRPAESSATKDQGSEAGPTCATSPDYSPAYDNEDSAPQDGQQHLLTRQHIDDVDLGSEYGYQSDIPSEDELLPINEDDDSRESDPHRPYGDDLEEAEEVQCDYPSMLSQSESVSSVPSVAGSFSEIRIVEEGERVDAGEVMPETISSGESSDEAEADENGLSPIAMSQNLQEAKNIPKPTVVEIEDESTFSRTEQGFPETGPSDFCPTAQEPDVERPAAPGSVSEAVRKAADATRAAAKEATKASIEIRECLREAESCLPAMPGRQPTKWNFGNSDAGTTSFYQARIQPRWPAPYPPSRPLRPYTDGPFAGPFPPVPAPVARNVDRTAAAMNYPAREELVATNDFLNRRSMYGSIHRAPGTTEALSSDPQRPRPTRVSIQDLVNGSREASLDGDAEKMSVGTSQAVMGDPPSEIRERVYMDDLHRIAESRQSFDAEIAMDSFPDAQPRSGIAVVVAPILETSQQQEEREVPPTDMRGTEHANVDPEDELEGEAELEMEDVEDGGCEAHAEGDDTVDGKAVSTKRAAADAGIGGYADINVEDIDFQTAPEWAQIVEDEPARKKQRRSSAKLAGSDHGRSMSGEEQQRKMGLDAYDSDDESYVVQVESPGELDEAYESNEGGDSDVEVIEEKLEQLRENLEAARAANKAQDHELAFLNQLPGCPLWQVMQSTEEMFANQGLGEPTDAAGGSGAAAEAGQSTSAAAAEEATQAPSAPSEAAEATEPTTGAAPLSRATMASLAAAAMSPRRHRHDRRPHRRRPAWRSFMTGALAGAATVIGAAAALLASVPADVREEALREL